MGCLIEWAHGGDHFWYSDRLVNSAIFWSNRADRPRSVGKDKSKMKVIESYDRYFHIQR
jgi:hypothetical protein